MESYIPLHSVPIGSLLEQDSIILDPIEKAASLVFQRAERFNGGYSFKEHSTSLCTKFFGNTNTLQQTGLIAQYRAMKTHVEENNLIGLVLLGLNMKDILIDYYPTADNNIITLNVDSICRCLIREHFTKEEVDTICRRTDGFDTYYIP